jgi:DNA-binding MarR family transcriptional regulator
MKLNILVTRKARNISGQLVTSVISSLRALSAETDRLDDVAARRYGLNRTDMRALEIIGREGPMAPTELARLLGFTTGGVTTVIDRLERAGYVRRRPDQTDRRRLVVEVTDATRQQDAELFGDLVRRTRAFAQSYSDDQLRIIQGFLEGAREITAAHSQALGADPIGKAP